MEQKMLVQYWNANKNHEVILAVQNAGFAPFYGTENTRTVLESQQEE